MPEQVFDYLPPLREDLGLFPGPVLQDGSPSWTIHDPVRNRYHRIGREAFDMLRHWHVGSAKKLLATLRDSAVSLPTLEEVEWMANFLHANMLVQRKSADDIAGLMRIAQASKSSWSRQLLHNYLFFRIPLVRPQRFLNATRKIADLFFSKSFLILLLCLGAIGVYLVARQWDGFLTTFMHFFTWQGVVFYGAALLFAKILHELGHAYSAHRAGCRVPSMGVAFLVMWPVLYTDTSDAWRLTDKKKRLQIGAAGMLAELGLAVVATFVWNFLPEGSLKSAAFLIATVTWLMTLAVNLNPFMRFDGYYLLSDWLEVENLQDRAFARAKWWMREKLFGLGDPQPEPFSETLGKILLVYAFGTWIYRFFLFLGIAVLVYAFFFKILGIFLFVVEILWFIGLPIWRELYIWWQRKIDMRWNIQTLRSLGLLVLLGAVLFVPWQGSVRLPAILDGEQSVRVFAPYSAQLEAIHIKDGERVKKGDLLFSLSSEDIDFQIEQTKRNIEFCEQLVKREAAGGVERQRIRILRQDLEREQIRLDSLIKGRDLLTVRSEIDGIVVDFDHNLSVGMWINQDHVLSRLVSPDKARLIAYVDEGEVDQLIVGEEATFYPDSWEMPKVKAVLRTVATVNTPYIDQAYLASTFGGEVAVEADKQKRLIPLSGTYRVSFDLAEGTKSPDQVIRGSVKVSAQKESIMGNVLRSVWAVLIRESAF